MIIHYNNGSCTGAWLRAMRTIEGECDCSPDIHDFVSNLRPSDDETPTELETEGEPA